MSGWESFASSIGIPKRLWWASFDDARPTEAITRAKAWVEKDFPNGRCLMLAGATGVGKTLAAVAALRATTTPQVAQEMRAPRQFVYFPSAVGRLLTPETRQGTLEMLTTCPFVVLDDLGVEYVKEGGLAETFLDEIIWYREANLKATIITTNLTVEHLRTRLPARLADRFRGEWGSVFECGGDSMRGAD